MHLPQSALMNGAIGRVNSYQFIELNCAFA